MPKTAPETLRIDWSNSQMREDGAWIHLEDSAGQLVAIIPRLPLEHFAATAPDDIMETGGGLVALLEAAIVNAYAAGRMLTDEGESGPRLLIVDRADFPDGQAQPVLN